MQNCNKENMQKLVDALRSGDYSQASNALRVKNEEGGKDTFCCLGVACDLYFQGQEKGWGQLDTSAAFAGPIKVPMSYKVFTKGFIERGNEPIEESYGKLTPEAMRWLGIENVDPTLDIPKIYQEKILNKFPGSPNIPSFSFCATQLNDQFHFTFGEIADCFEHTFLKNLDASEESKDSE